MATIKSSDVIIGTCAEQTSLKPVGNQSLFFVSRVSPETTKEGLSKYLKEKGVEESECVDLSPRFRTYKSFKIAVPEQSSHRILDPGFWPTGVLVRIFLQKKRGPRSSPSFLGRTVYRTVTT